MKIIRTIFIVMLGLFVTSCEDVIEVDLDTAEPKLVIDAAIDWEKDTPGNEQMIKLTTTTGYYEDSFPVVSGAMITITNSTGMVFDFIENIGTGEYLCSNFQPEIGETYTLEVIVNEQVYTATETMISGPDLLDEIIQNNEGGITGDDIELSTSFQDDGTQENYYLSSFKPETFPFPEFQLDDDEFFQGNMIPLVYSNEDFFIGELVSIKLYGISRNYYDYFGKIMDASGNDGGPFQTPVSVVRGNIVNQTNFNNYPLGYFRLSEVDVVEYTIQ